MPSLTHLTDEKNVLNLPAIDPSLSPSALVADAVKRSTKAHLFHFYDVFCEIIAIPRRPPSVWVMADAPDGPEDAEAEGPLRARARALSWNSVASGDVVAGVGRSKGSVVEVDSRTLVKQCLKELRLEMGIGQ